MWVGECVVQRMDGWLMRRNGGKEQERKGPQKNEEKIGLVCDTLSAQSASRSDLFHFICGTKLLSLLRLFLLLLVKAYSSPNELRLGDLGCRLRASFSLFYAPKSRFWTRFPASEDGHGAAQPPHLLKDSTR